MHHYMRFNPLLANKMTTTDNKLKKSTFHDEDGILELDADKVTLVADTFSKVEMYLQSDTKRGYVKLNAPGLYSFQMPDHPDGDRESTTHNEDDDSTLTDSWTKESLDEINLINEDDEAQLGVIQRDEETGEMYILMPLEVDVLLHPGSSVMSEQPSSLTIVDSSTTIAGMSVEDEEDASQTTLTENPRPLNVLHADQADREILCEHEVCRFVVPKMSLKFKLTLQVGEPNDGEEIWD
ncbi:uncharacterized protein LOC135427387 [Drosophila montana]|uniref:uncharacterized protein LOC135427387 n=1 Tax=Drosophila montana TaxID=40370 RepID=UPI00313DB639